MTGRGLLMSQVALTTHLRLASLVLYSLWPLSCKTLPAWPLSLSLKKDGFCPVRIFLKAPSFPCLLSLAFSNT